MIGPRSRHRAPSLMRIFRRSAFLVVLLLTTACNREFVIDLLPSSSDASPDGNGGSSFCKADIQCGQPFPYCDLTSGECIACRTTDDCPNQVCNPTSHSCVACVGHQDCSPKHPFCEPLSSRCVDCLANADCHPSSMACNLATHACARQCKTGAECSGSAALCEVALGVCVQCHSNADCTVATKSRCASGECVECLSSAECPSVRPACNPNTKTCVGCLSNTECASELCNAGNECVGN